MHSGYLEKIKFDLLRTNQAETYYYANVLFAMVTVWTESISTAAVDEKNLFINPTYLLAQTPEQAIGLIAHEMNHITRRHMTVFRFYNKKIFSADIEWGLWNESTDHAINLDLNAAGYTLPDGALMEDRFLGLAPHEIYYILHDEYAANPRNLQESDIVQIIDDGSAGGARKFTDIDDRITRVVVRAAAATKAAKNLDWDKVSSGLKRIIGEAENPKLDLASILGNYMTKYNQEGTDSSRPKRRYLPDFYLPSNSSTSLCDLGIVFDVSGSVSDEVTAIFYRALVMIKEQLKPDKISIIQFGSQIVSEHIVTDMEGIKDIQFGNGGGTNINPVMDWISEEAPEVTLIFTDGCFYEQDDLTGKDIIWIIQNNPNFRAPEGIIIHHTT